MWYLHKNEFKFALLRLNCKVVSWNKRIKFYPKSFQVALEGIKFRIFPTPFQVAYRRIAMFCLFSNFTLFHIE